MLIKKYVEENHPYSELAKKYESIVGLVMIKRFFDLVASCLGLIFIWPFFIIIAIMIALDSKGPIFLDNIELENMPNFLRW